MAEGGARQREAKDREGKAPSSKTGNHRDAFPATINQNELTSSYPPRTRDKSQNSGRRDSMSSATRLQHRSSYTPDYRAQSSVPFYLDSGSLELAEDTDVRKYQKMQNRLQRLKGRKATRRKTPPLVMPPRDFYSIGNKTAGEGGAAAASAQRGRPVLPGVNALFPIYPGRSSLAPGSGTRIELHAHLIGSIRYETIWEYMRLKKLVLPGDGSVAAVRECLIAKSPMSFNQFLEPIPIYMESFIGDYSAMERIAYEFCEDKVRQGVLYAEVRYCPHLFMSSKHPRNRAMHELSEIVMAMNRGFRLGEVELGIVVRTILVIVIGLSGCNDIVNLCQQFQEEGVVGIDLHLPIDGIKGDNDTWLPGFEEVPLSRDEVRAFLAAAAKGIHRTVHAGLIGSAYMVQRALDKYRAQRLGHGYEVLKLPNVYNKCRERNVHFECCPWLSLLTGAVDPSIPRHPIAQFAHDGVNFSLSTGFSTLTGSTLQEEYDLATTWGLTEAHLVRANINALRSSFLSSSEKSQLMQTLLENIGIKKRHGRR